MRIDRGLACLTAIGLGLLVGLSVSCSVPEEPAPATAETAEPSGLEYATWETSNPGDYAKYNQRANLIQRGRIVYDLYCVGCHGEAGDGYGPAAERLITRPRDFTSGIYKFRSTDSGSLPLDADLHRTITRGLARVSMPAFPLMPERDKVAVIEYIKSFYPRWDEQIDDRIVVPVPRAPLDLASEQRVARGHVVYLEMECYKCHGFDGAGRGATQTSYVDAWGDEQRPFNFTRGSLKNGNGPEDVYRTFRSGLRSIMPAYEADTLVLPNAASLRQKSLDISADERASLEAVLGDFPESSSAVFDSLTDAQRADLAERNSWDLVAYVLSLRNETSTASAVLGTN